MNPATKNERPSPFLSLCTDEVELLARAMRKFDLDGIIDPDAANLGETIIKAGIATFPSSTYILIQYANFMMEVRKDGPASRTQLQASRAHVAPWGLTADSPSKWTLSVFFCSHPCRSQGNSLRTLSRGTRYSVPWRAPSGSRRALSKAWTCTPTSSSNAITGLKTWHCLSWLEI